MAARTRTWVLFAFAIATGGLAAYLALRYLRQQAAPLLNQESAGNVAVLANRDIPVGAVIQERDIRTVDWPGEALPPGFHSDPQQVIGRGVVSGFRPNEPVLESKLAPKGAGGGLPMLIDEGMRALSVRVDDIVGVAGFVIPGTRVDVMLTMSDPDVGREPTTRIIMQNIQALASGQSIQLDPEGKPMSVPVVTFLVTPAQAETLALAAGQGRIQMTLRNTLDTVLVETQGARKSTLLASERKALGPTRRAIVRRQRNPEQVIVEGFQGGQKTVRRFSAGGSATTDTTQ